MTQIGLTKPELQTWFTSDISLVEVPEGERKGKRFVCSPKQEPTNPNPLLKKEGSVQITLGQF